MPSIISLIFLLLPSVGHSVSGWSYVEEDSAVVKIGNGCTGTRVSNEGHILTARHCFNGCLIAGEFVDVHRLFPEYGWQSPKLYHLNQTASCSVAIDGEEKNVEVLAIGPGFMTPMEQGSLTYTDPDLYSQFLENSYFHNGDFAVIKEEVENDTSCKKVNFNGVKVGASVFYRGYPMESTGRPEGRNSDGESLLEGEGEVIASILENSCIGDNPLNPERLTQRYDREELLLSTVDNLPGGSGSGLLNEEGEIIGVINSQYRQGVDVQSTYCAGSTVAVSAKHIKKLLRESGLDDQVETFFNCR